MWFIVGYFHAQRRIKQGKPPLLYHRVCSSYLSSARICGRFAQVIYLSSWFRHPSVHDSCPTRSLHSLSINNNTDRGTETNIPCTISLPQRTIPITPRLLITSHHPEARKSTLTKNGLRLHLVLHPVIRLRKTHHRVQGSTSLSSLAFSGGIYTATRGYSNSNLSEGRWEEDTSIVSQVVIAYIFWNEFACDWSPESRTILFQ